MARLPRASGAEAIRALGKLGFHQVRQRGNQVVFQSAESVLLFLSNPPTD
jgi:predicted RNA binding protein YcfA (HicA-like mRNA interferase family)